MRLIELTCVFQKTLRCAHSTAPSTKRSAVLHPPILPMPSAIDGRTMAPANFHGSMPPRRVPLAGRNTRDFRAVSSALLSLFSLSMESQLAIHLASISSPRLSVRVRIRLNSSALAAFNAHYNKLSSIQRRKNVFSIFP